MAFVAGYSRSEAQLLMTFCSLAYEDPTPLPGESIDAQRARMARDINAQLAPAHFTDWQVVWGPALNDDRSNMLYVAGNAATRQYALAIRGTNWAYIEDWMQDVGSVLPLIGFPYLLAARASGEPQIATGTLIGLQTLIGMQDPSNSMPTLAAFLQDKLWAGADVFVTGHSLGGCLASVVAPWLVSLQGGADHIKVYTFAAPSAGNSDFADYYNALFVDATGNSTAYRVYNSLDIVPNAWASLGQIAAMYQPAPLATLEIKAIVASAALTVGNNYTQVGVASQRSAVELQGSLFGAAAEAVISFLSDTAFVNQIDQQHATSTYLRLV